MMDNLDMAAPTVSESVRRLPAAGLRALIADYHGYRQVGQPPGRHRGLPSPFLTLIVTFDVPLVVAAHPRADQPAGRYDVLLGGLHTSPALIEVAGRQGGIQVAVRPLGARALFGVPAGELAEIDVHAADVVGASAGQTWEQMQAATSWPERFDIIDRWLLACSRLDRTPAAQLAEAWRLLAGPRPASSVERIAEAVGWSSRHLRNRIREETGLTPMAAARVARFDRARRLLQHRKTSGRPVSLADLAAATGYFDQAHLAREFRELAGCPPSQWLAEEFRNVQASDERSRTESGS
jgi:AraC-like DNA-binding protein